MKIAAFVIAPGAAVLPLVAQETVKVHLVEVPVTAIDHDGIRYEVSSRRTGVAVKVRTAA